MEGFIVENKYKISGMSCAACSARVERAVAKVEGVEEVSVSLLTNSMAIEGDFEEKKVIDAVKKAGYGISPKGIEAEKKEEKKQNFAAKLLVSVLILSSCSKEGISEIPIPENTGSSSEESPETSLFRGFW